MLSPADDPSPYTLATAGTQNKSLSLYHHGEHSSCLQGAKGHCPLGHQVPVLWARLL